MTPKISQSRILLRFIMWWICGVVLSNHPIVQTILQTQRGVSIEQQASLKTLENVYSILKNEYYDKDKVSLTWMWEWGIKWFVQALKDPHTEYLPFEQNKDFEEQLEGQEEFEWIGAAVEKKDDAVMIQEVFKWTPAAIAGLRPMDYILEINWEKTKELTISEAVKKIRWPKWTTVKLLIFRQSEKDPAKRVFTVEATRQNVKIPSVRTEIIVQWGKNIVYIEIALIWEQTETLLKQEIEALKEKKVDWVLLDLRWNGGWYLPKAVEIASHFIPKDKIIVTGRYSILPTEQFTSKGYWDFETTPIVVLVDALTASAWEIIAGALRQHRQALLVGTTTFGKWSIQTIVEVWSGAWLKYTIGKRYLPDDTNIDHEWIKPDIEVEFNREEYEKNRKDVQKEKGIEELIKLIK